MPYRLAIALSAFRDAFPAFPSHLITIPKSPVKCKHFFCFSQLFRSASRPSARPLSRAPPERAACRRWVSHFPGPLEKRWSLAKQVRQDAAELRTTALFSERERVRKRNLYAALPCHAAAGPRLALSSLAERCSKNPPRPVWRRPRSGTRP